MTNDSTSALLRVQNYLGNGGLFNPEMMEHEKVRDLLMDCREEIVRLRNENEMLRRNMTLWRWGHDEIEFACGGEIAMQVREKVMKRRAAILTEEGTNAESPSVPANALAPERSSHTTSGVRVGAGTKVDFMSAINSLNVLGKWRTLFAGWQLGTRAKGNPEADAVRDHREVTLLLRAEVSALTGLLVRKGLITAEEFDGALASEADQLNSDLSKRFPGVTASENGLHMDIRRIQEAGWMKGWKP